jgi:7-cyano-7-deazaguanine synthase
MKAVLILSGGLDSSTLAYWLKANGYNEIICVTFDYGQKQIIELKSAAAIAKNLGAEHRVIDLSFIKEFLSKSSSSLTNPSISVPSGEYTKDNMQSTVVPNRNSMMLTMAWTIACVERANVLAYGAHGGDHYIYPDTRPDYFNAINLSLRLGTKDSRADNLNLIAPFITWDKAEIIRTGYKLNVPFAQTWTCYEGCEIHCGICGACSERKKGFTTANIPDPTLYKS